MEWPLFSFKISWRRLTSHSPVWWVWESWKEHHFGTDRILLDFSRATFRIMGIAFMNATALVTQSFLPISWLALVYVIGGDIVERTPDGAVSNVFGTLLTTGTTHIFSTDRSGIVQGSWRNRIFMGSKSAFCVIEVTSIRFEILLFGKSREKVLLEGVNIKYFSFWAMEKRLDSP